MDLYSNMNRSYKYAYGSMLKGEQQASFKPANTGDIDHGRYGQTVLRHSADR